MFKNWRARRAEKKIEREAYYARCYERALEESKALHPAGSAGSKEQQDTAWMGAVAAVVTSC